MHNNRILVTGATGFIGSNLVKRFALEGWDVHVIVRESSYVGNLQSNVTAHVYQGSIDSMLYIMEAVQPLTVYHLASMFKAEHSIDDVTVMLRSNIEMGTHLVEAMVRSNVKYLVNTGTSWQNYENADYNPVCLYAATKQAFEDILRYYVEAFPLKVVNLKLFDSYGPDDKRMKLFSLLKRAASSETVQEMSEGYQLIDLVYIDDIIDAFVIAQRYQLNNQTSKMDTYAVSSGKPIALREVAEVYSRTLNKKLNIAWGKRPYRQREVMIPWDEGELLPGWSAKIGLEKGIKLMEKAET